MPKFSVIDGAVLNTTPTAVYNSIMGEYSGKTHFWMPDFEFKPKGGNPMDQVGSTCDTIARGRGMTARFCERVTAINPGEFIEFEISGDFTGTEKWTFEPLADGQTKANVAWIGDSNKLILSLVSPFVNIEKELHKSRQKLLKILQDKLQKE